MDIAKVGSVHLQLPYLKYAKSVFRPKQLESMFLFVTSACNSRCRTCFYWEELNTGRDLSLDQIQAISQSAPPFSCLWISGGEPFLRKELAEIIELFYRNNGVRRVNLPTNGLLPAKVDAVISKLLTSCPELVIDLNFSLDGLANTHDTIRGLPNNFEKTLTTIDMAAAKWGPTRRLRRNVVTVITRNNYLELVQLGLDLVRESRIDGQYFEIIRGNPLDQALKSIPKDDLARLHRCFLALHEHYADKLFDHLRQPGRALARAWYLGNVKFHFDIHQRNHYGRSEWPMACTAGRTTIVIDHDGHFRSCELRPKLGQLQDFEFNVSAALHSSEMEAEISAIPKTKCWCTHSCFIHNSARMSPKVMLFHVPWAYLRHRWSRLPLTSVEEIEKFRVTNAPVPAADM